MHEDNELGAEIFVKESRVLVAGEFMFFGQCVLASMGVSAPTAVYAKG